MNQPSAHPEMGNCYLIILKGQLDPQWADWFEGFQMTHAEDGTTRFYGSTLDQSQLHGLLRHVRDLGIPLLLVVQVNMDHERLQWLLQIPWDQFFNHSMQ